LAQLLRETDIVDKVDSCVSQFRKKDFLNEDLIWKVIQVEWEKGDTHCLLVRATHGGDDIKKMNKQGEERPHSLSFGMSLFSGIMHDVTACPFSVMREQSCGGYCLALSKEELRHSHSVVSSLFYIPEMPCLLALHGIGEFFHPRTKVYIHEEDKNAREKFVSGSFSSSFRRLPSFLCTSNQEHVNTFQNIRNKYTAIVL